MRRKIKTLIILLPAVLLALVFPAKASAETLTLQVTQDTYANAAYPDKVNGSFGSVIISNKFTERLAFLQFEDIDLPEDATINSALLKIYIYEAHYATAAKFNVGPITSDWEENTLTWNSKPTIDQAQATENEIVLENGWKTISVTNLVKKWADNSLENKGLFIYPFGFLYGTAESEFALSFKSKEAGENPAVIEIEYQLPEPPTPTPTSTPTPTPTPKPVLAETTEESSPEAEETTPTPEVLPEATPEAGFLSKISTKEIAIGAISLLLALAAGIFFAVAYLKKKPKKASKSPEEKPAEETEDEEL